MDCWNTLFLLVFIFLFKLISKLKIPNHYFPGIIYSRLINKVI